jgi:hypothetical protein
VRDLCLTDRFFLLTQALRCDDCLDEWIYARC